MRKAFLSDAQVLQARIPIQAPMMRRESGAAKYHGDLAKGYDTKREESEKWKAEDRIVREMLSGFPSGTSILDVPVGTGRFIPLYEELGFSVLGLDVSDDMLREASQKAKADSTFLRLGDALKLDLPDDSYDVAICIRLMRWLETRERQLQVISELMRVAKNRVIFNVRTETGPLPLPVSEIARLLGDRAALYNDSWSVARQEQIIEDFTMLMLERAA